MSDSDAWERAKFRDALAAKDAEIARLTLERDYAADMLGNDRADIARLREALLFLLETKWKSVDKDNMEFEGRVTCYQLDKARAALNRNPPGQNKE